MGDDFVEMAYESHYALLRRLFRAALKGMHFNHDFYEAEAIIEEWSKMKALFKDKET